MNEAETIKFQGQEYFDDRLYILYLCKGTVEIKPDDDGAIWTTIYHEQAPASHIWCVVTYRNCKRYPLYRVDSFHEKDDAISYIRKIEPETPLISLNGSAPLNPIPYEEYLAWKKKNNFRKYDFQTVFTSGGMNPRETIGQTKEQFKGIL